MSDLGTTLVDNLGEWEELPPITLSRWQVRMVLQSLARSYDDYQTPRPANALVAIRGIVIEDVTALLQATINDIALQAGLIASKDVSVVQSTTEWVAGTSE